MRTFVDNWFAYFKGGPFLNSKGNPKWFNNPDPRKEEEALSAMHSISKDAREIINGDKGRLMKDHSVPVRELRELMRGAYEEGRLSEIKEIKQFLEKYCCLGVITKEEDNRLNDKKLRSKIPDGWNSKDMFARYAEVGIEGDINNIYESI